jgi:hypothetical protein
MAFIEIAPVAQEMGRKQIDRLLPPGVSTATFCALCEITQGAGAEGLTLAHRIATL